MNIDSLRSKADLAKELGLDANDINFEWQVEQKTANWDKKEAQQLRNKFFPKIIGAGKSHLSFPTLVRRTKARTDID